MAALVCAACSSHSEWEEEKPIAPVGNDPISFTRVDEASVEHSAATRSAVLQTGFVVSTYKYYGQTQVEASESTVMDRYSVDYKESRDDWNGVVISNWNYVNVNNLFTGNRQEEKFWDYSGFPYRFHAVAPANGNSITASHIKTLSNNELFIDNATYMAQTFSAPASADATMLTSANTTITPSNKEAEPYLVAQVSRNTNGEDRDIIKDEEINNASNGKNRRVALPFHHLNSKVRFGVYTYNLSQTAQHDYISDLVITVEKLATSATSFKAYGQDSWISDYGFSGFQGITVEDEQTIFTFNQTATGGTSKRSYADNDLSLHQGKSSAYWLECPDGIMQLPQNGVKLHIKMTIRKEDGTERFFFYDYEIKKESDAIDPTHWIAGCIHSYYLCLELDDESLPILTVTATLTPWEDVTGSLSTDLEQ
ncbi:MAG: hypothetical protein MJY79_00705 [Bacteroidaceae bacterium]|nr:hypothetical protein [Bacteroidaceae bacterium]